MPAQLGTVFFCQHCGCPQRTTATVGGWPILEPCERCGGMYFHTEHPADRRPNWEPLITVDSVMVLMELGIPWT